MIFLPAIQVAFWLHKVMDFLFLFLFFNKVWEVFIQYFKKKNGGGALFLYLLLWLPDTLTGLLDAAPQVFESLLIFLVIQSGSFLLICPQIY